MLSFSSVQTSLAKRLTKYVNKKYNTQISIDKVDLSKLSHITIKGVYAKDPQQDTMVYVGNLQTDLESVNNLYHGKPNFGKTTLSDVVLKLKTYEGAEKSAFDVFVEKLSGEKSDKPSGFELNIREISLKNAHFRLYDLNKQNDVIEQYDDINANLQQFSVLGPQVKAKIRNLSMRDKRGLEVTDMQTDFFYSKTEMYYKNIQLRTTQSFLTGNLIMTYAEGDLSDFNNKVQLHAEITQADLSMVDVQKFYSEFGTTDVWHLTTKMEGSLNNFTLKDLDLKTHQQAKLKGDYHLINAFDRDSGFKLDARISQLETDREHLANLLPHTLGKKLPISFAKLGHISVQGRNKMDMDEMDAFLTIQTALGNFKTDLLLYDFQDVNKVNYDGVIEVEKLKLGDLVDNPLIGNLSMVSDIKGKSFILDKLDVQIDAKVSDYQYKGYDYSQIALQGAVLKKQFRGKMQINDPNIQMTFDGLADLSKEQYIFDFDADVNHAEFKKLHLFERDSISILKGNIKMNMVGNTLENMTGTIGFTNATYTNEIKDYFFKDFKIESRLDQDIQTLEINSPDIVSGYIKGTFIYTEFLKIAQNAIGSIYTNYVAYKISKGQSIEFKFNIYNQAVGIFFPEVILGPNTFIRGEINPDDELFKLTFRSPEVIAYDNYFEKIRLQIDNKNPLFNTQLFLDKLKTKAYEISEFNLVNLTLNDTLFFRSEFKGGVDQKDIFNLSFYHTITDGNRSEVVFQDSDVLFNGTLWNLVSDKKNQNRVIYNPHDKSITYDSFLMTSNHQSISFYGSQRGSDYRDYNIDLDRVLISQILPEYEQFKLDGLINAGIWIEKRNNMLIPKVDLQVIDFEVNGELQGDLVSEIKGDDSNKEYQVNVSLENEMHKSLNANGRIDFTQSDPMIYMVLNFNNFNISPLNALGKGVVENIRGKLSGEAGINGKLSNPVFSGMLTLDKAGMYFPYINVDYALAENSFISLENQSIKLDKVGIQDTYKQTKGILNGKVNHSHFKKWNLDLVLETDNLLALNTLETDESLFYGMGYLEGLAYFTGNTENINISIIGSSNPGTEIIIPMSDLKTVETSRLIHFKKPDSEPKENLLDLQKQFSENFHGVTMNFDFEINKNAIIKIVIDKTTGSFIRGTGNGNILMDIDTKGTFNMYGDYIVDNGIYNFKYGGIINKPFKVKKGGTISFSGDPYKAELDIEAVYSVKANPKVILTDYESNRNLLVNLSTKITGELFNSSQEFDIKVPNASVDLTSQLDFVLNKQDSGNLMRQYVSLLTIGNFFNEEHLTNTTSSVKNEGITSVAMALSNALMDVFSDPDDKIKFGFDYTIGNQGLENLYTDNQLGVSVSTKLGKNENFIINGEVIVPTGNRSNANVAGTVSIEFPPLNKKETLYLNVFNRQNEIQYSDEEEGYTQGLGLSWQVNFDSGKELLEKMGFNKKKYILEKKSTQIQDTTVVKPLNR